MTRIGSVSNIANIPKVANSTERNNYPSEDGDIVVQLDDYRLYVYDGTLPGWKVFSASAADFTVTDEFDVASLGQTEFTLSKTPINPANASSMTVNGVGLTYGQHYVISGNVATFYPTNAGFSLEDFNEFGQPDRVVIQYME